MDAVRKAMGLPAGTKPKWYEICDRAYDPDEELDSDDEPYPDGPARKATPLYPRKEFSKETIQAYIDLVFGPE